MEGKNNNRFLLLLCQIFLSGLAVDALSYDYSASIECLTSPLKPQYGGGIVGNPELDHGVTGWTTFGDAQIEQRVSKEGNNFIVAHHRNQPHDSFSQKFYLEKGKLYTFSAWLQVSEENAQVAAIFKTQSGFEHAGWVVAKSGCWSMLKGGLTVNASGPADIYFESKNTSVEIWADNISLQPFTEEEWRSHQQQSIEKARKSSVKLVAVDADGNPVPNATVTVTQINGRFPFGCAISDQIIYNTGYQNWFKSKFKYTTFENEMKWDSTEYARGREDYSKPDAMLRFTSQNGISVRGHNILWDDKRFVPGWAQSLSPRDLRFAVDNRVNSIVRRYYGKVISWDVVNENLHFNFYESVFGKYASAILYSKVNGIDGGTTTLYLNEYNTIEEPGDGASSPDKYLEKIRELRLGGYKGPLGIGLQGHFRTPNLPYMRAAIDKLASTGLPVWLSEIDVVSGPNQAVYLEQVLREGHGHPSVRGISLWSAWRPQGCYTMCLTDNNFRNLPTGDVVDKLIREWGTFPEGFSGVTDSKGRFEARLFHGDYKVTVTHPNINGSSVVDQSFECLATPLKPQYGGGIVANPELDHGLKGWTAFGDAHLEQKVSKGGNNFIAASNRHGPRDSFSQKFYLEKGKFYTFSAWLQVSQGNAKVAANFKTMSGFQQAGWVVAKSGCWSMLKGGLIVNSSGPVDLYFESSDASTEIWADNISLQPFTKEQWKSHQSLSIQKARKSLVKLLAVDAKGNPLANATVSITQERPSFPLGCAMTNHILTNLAYQNWFKSRFTITTFENEMKWASTEPAQGREDFSVPNSMLRFAAQNGVSVRGHNVVSNDPKNLPEWTKLLSANEFRLAVERRVNSVVKRYAGKVIAWDVVNENMHFNYFESVYGRNASAVLFGKVHELDRGTTLFLNEFNTIETMYDGDSKPDKYLEKIREIRMGGYVGPIGIGLEAHFGAPNLPYMRASIDKLAATGVPVWLTEVDVASGPNQALHLEQVLREAHAHPNVQGIVIWAAWRPEGCWRMCLTDNNFKNLPTGDVVDRLIREWSHPSGFSGTTDFQGRFETRLFHGDYKVTVTHPNAYGVSSQVARGFKVGSGNGESKKRTRLHVKVSA
ncbi:hypothetical protein RHMOL_Rhmol11G0230600 [Rhododendron molle]|uniref:Uncharacterized protein n=1 Tax=Rhododendron molle TaxID=49168 RepID=A0ACC0LVS4_RHOML|nr:hypothetical protein RHMOL_Rhmol11G0230600 [Rhododendron molle]